MTPGRSPFMKTGRGIPSALMQTNIGTGEDIKAEAKRKAEADAKAKLEALGKNEGASTNVREVQGTATVTRKGQPVEKQAQTPKEIEAWKAAKAKAESEGKPFGEKYNTQTATETVKLSDTGADKPKKAVNSINTSLSNVGQFVFVSTRFVFSTVNSVNQFLIFFFSKLSCWYAFFLQTICLLLCFN